MIYPNPIADYDRVPYKFFRGACDGILSTGLLYWLLAYSTGYWLTLLATGLKGKEWSVATVTIPEGKILGEGGYIRLWLPSSLQISSHTAIYI